MGSSHLHVVARRGARALAAKSAGKMNKIALEVEEKRQQTSVRDLAELAKSLTCLHAFPIRLKLALCKPLINFDSERVLLFTSAFAYGYLTRSDSDPSGRPLWARHMPMLYHPSKKILSDRISDGIVRLTALLTQKVLRHDQAPEKQHFVIAELIVAFFLISVVKEESEWTDEERLDSGTAAAPLVNLIWLAEVLLSSFRSLAAELLNVIDDQFTDRVSPYRGLNLSKPEWSVINAPLAEAFSRVGVRVTTPQDPQDEIQTARFKAFVTELFVASAAINVLKSVQAQCFKLMSSFNSRQQKIPPVRPGSSEASSVSFQAMLTRPWSDDGEVRSLKSVFGFLAKIVKPETAMAAVLGNVLSGLWRGVAQSCAIDKICASAKQGDKRVNMSTDGWLPGEVLKFAAIKRLGLRPEYEHFVTGLSNHKRESAVTKLQAMWRGSRVRKSMHLHTVAEYIQNTNWPDLPQLDSLDDEFNDPVPTNTHSTLTRASLMRLPKGAGHERPTTPGSSSVGTRPTNAVSLPETGIVPDLMQADHIACAKLIFIFMWQVLQRRRMEQYWRSLMAAMDKTAAKFGELIEQNPQYAEAMVEASAELKKAAAKRLVRTALPKVPAVRKSESLVGKLGKEVRDEFLSKVIVLKPPPSLSHKRHLGKAVVQERTVKQLDSTSPRTERTKTSYMEEYLRLSGGDDSILRDITDAVSEQLTEPSDWSPLWLSIKATRFASARARLISVLRSDKAKSSFYTAEESLDFFSCIACLGDTTQGCLDIFASTTNAPAFWVECVFHLIVGFTAQAVKAGRIDIGLSLLKTTVSSFKTALKRLQPEHHMALEAMILDSAIGFANAFPLAARDELGPWFSEAADRYTRLGHSNRLARVCLRYGCVLTKLGQITHAETAFERAHKTMSSRIKCPLSLVCAINKAFLNAAKGHLEAAEVEIREVCRLCKDTETPGTVHLRSIAEHTKLKLVSLREAKHNM